MNRERLKGLINRLAGGECSESEALDELKHFPYENLGYARVDQHRQLRQGLPEVIYSPGKTADQIQEIARRLRQSNELVMATRVSKSQSEALLVSPDCSFYPDASIMLWGKLPEADAKLGKVALITAGTSDLPVAAEAELTLKASSIASDLFADMGVAGLHRLLDSLPKLVTYDLCIVFAGMDGALPSVVGGLLSCPVIACPTSVGYGAALEGLSALLSMLNSCASGLCVVNIDNGFGAAVAAYKILNLRS